MKKFLSIFGLALFLLLPVVTSAHEVYVLSSGDIAHDIEGKQFNVLNAFQNPYNLKFGLFALGLALVTGIIFIVVGRSKAGDKARAFFEYFHNGGTLLLRLTIAVSFYYSAMQWSFLGPELPLGSFPQAELIRAFLFLISFLIFFGFLTGYASVVGIVIFSVAALIFKSYMLTYVSYVGELIALIFLGAGSWSIDHIVFKTKVHFESLKKYEVPLIRMTYGASLIYAAVYVKFLHPLLTLQVVEQYHLTRFYLLFPSDPYLVVAGAAIAELLIGLAIFFGFQMRFAILYSVFYVTLSLLFFGESVWPHFILYGASLYLLTHKNTHSVDSLLLKWRRRA